MNPGLFDYTGREIFWGDTLMRKDSKTYLSVDDVKNKVIPQWQYTTFILTPEKFCWVKGEVVITNR